MGTTPIQKEVSSAGATQKVKLMVVRSPAPPPVPEPYNISVVPPPEPIVETKPEPEPVVEAANVHVRRRKIIWQPNVLEANGKVQRINVNATGMIASRVIKSALVTPTQSISSSPTEPVMESFTEAVRKGMSGVTVKQATLALEEEKLPLIYQRSSQALSKAKLLRRSHSRLKLNIPRKNSDGQDMFVREGTTHRECEPGLRRIKSFNITGRQLSTCSPLKALEAIGSTMSVEEMKSQQRPVRKPRRTNFTLVRKAVREML